MGLVHLAGVRADRDARSLDQQVGSTLGDGGQLADGGVVLGVGEGRASGVAAGGAGEPGDDDSVGGVSAIGSS